ncbi:MAG: hypothetical protein N2544_18085, partial [Burkholderiales bacterium]|nr:hypothetical protein [Burkholderiales bacterium]
YTPKEIEEEVGSIMRLSGFDKDDKNYWPTYTRLYKGTINYVQSSGSRPTLLDLRKYMEDTLVPAMPEGEEPGLLGYIMGTAAETSLDLPAGERERAEVPPYSTLDTAQRERLATVLARDYGAPLSQDEVRQIMESATKAGLSSTLENLRDIARQMRRMRGGG